MQRAIQAFLFLSIVLITLASCLGKKTNSDTTYKEAALQLERSTNTLQTATTNTLLHLNSKTYESAMSDKGNLRFSMARQVDSILSTKSQRLNTLKSSVVNPDSVSRLFKSLKSELFQIDSALFIIFGNDIDSLVLASNLVFTEEAKPEKDLAFSIIQNRLEILKNKMIVLCNEQVGTTADIFYTRIPLINQNLTTLKPDEVLEVNVGVGYLSYPSTPRIHINGDSIERGSNGFYRYEMKVSGKPGKYAIPIAIEYYDDDTKKVNVSKTVEYTIKD